MTENCWKMLKLKNSNKTFPVIFKHCVLDPRHKVHSRSAMKFISVLFEVLKSPSLGVACHPIFCATTRFSSFLFGLERRSRLPQLVVLRCASDFSFVVELNQSEETRENVSMKISTTCGLNGPLNFGPTSLFKQSSTF